MTRRAALAALLVVLSPIAFAKAEFRPFHSGSFEQVLAARTGQPFLLVLWSVTCAPCRQEFEMLSELRKTHPKMPLVLISTDDIADRKIAGQIISRYGLGNVESWIFADVERHEAALRDRSRVVRRDAARLFLRRGPRAARR